MSLVISARLTFILTRWDALLLFRICNLCYYGRVVHGNEMLRTFGCTALFFGDHHPARCYSYGSPAVHRLLLRAALKSHFTGTVRVPSAQKTLVGQKSTSGRRKRTNDRFQMWSDSSDVQETNKASVLLWSHRMCHLWSLLLRAA